MNWVFFEGRVPQTMRLAALGLPPYRVFTMEEIEDLTNNFDPSNLMGEECQGQVKHYLILTICRISIYQEYHNVMEPTKVMSSLPSESIYFLGYSSTKAG